MQGLLGEETYIAPVASLATAVSEQGRNICLRPAGTIIISGIERGAALVADHYFSAHPGSASSPGEIRAVMRGRA
ncbi:MAG: hypothetical protein ACYCVB_05280, partial [Bacilli bacterium]